MTIRPITNRELWNAFVTTQPHYSFLHSWEWGQIQKVLGEEVLYLGFYQGEQLAGVGLLLGVQARRGRHWLCPHGPLFVSDGDFFSGLAELVDYVRRLDFPATALRIAPLRLSGSQLLQEFQRAGFRLAPLHVHAELTWLLDITADQADLLRGMRKTTRHAIRKAEEQQLQIDVINDASALSRFLPLYEQTGHRHGFVPFSAKTLATQLEVFCRTNSAYTVVARHQGEDIAAAILIHFGNTVYYYHGASRTGLAVPGPHYVQWQAILEAKRRGARTYNFWGIAPPGASKHPFAGITVFKQGFGGYSLDYVRAHDYPLSWRYRALWLVDSWRKWRRGF